MSKVNKNEPRLILSFIIIIIIIFLRFQFISVWYQIKKEILNSQLILGVFNVMMSFYSVNQTKNKIYGWENSFAKNKIVFVTKLTFAKCLAIVKRETCMFCTENLNNFFHPNRY